MASFMRFYLIVFQITLIAILNPCSGQGRWILDPIPSPGSNEISWRKSFRDSVKLRKYISAKAFELRHKNYPGLSFDSMEMIRNEVRLLYHSGPYRPQLNWFIPDTFLFPLLTKLKAGQKSGNTLAGANLMRDKVLRILENNGYPFASLNWEEEPQSSRLRLTGSVFDLVKIDTVIIEGKLKISRKFLYRYLDIRPGKPYDESAIISAEQRLNAMEFAEAAAPVKVAFRPEGAEVKVALKDRKASQFYFILGLLPGSSGRKVLITGDALLNLFSPFGAGEQIFFQWQKMQPKTQKLIASFSYPFLAGLPVGVSARFEFFKRDTSWIDLNWDYAVQYQLSGLNYLKLGVRQQEVFPLNTDTIAVKLSRSLPGIQRISSVQAMIEANWQKLDYRFNPTSGWQLKMLVTGGVKSLLRDNAVTSLKDEQKGSSFAWLYDSVRLKHFQFSISVHADKYWKLARRMTILTGLTGKFQYSPLMVQNELYRLGGMNNLRGFDEETFFTPSYTLLRIEFRYLLSKNAFYYIFYNHAAFSGTQNYSRWLFPFGFGSGVSLETKAGIFTISYAMGTLPGESFSWRNGKIHFGYINYF
jgi:outer membrane protein assembly factor BamA